MALMQRYTRSQFVYSTYGQPVFIGGSVFLGEIEPSTLELGGVTYTAVVPGTTGDDISVEYIQFTPAVAASRVIGGVTYTADTAGAAGNGITIEYIEFTPAVAASLAVQDITYTADATGPGGNSITIEYTGGGTAGAEVVSVIGNAISVQIQSGVSTATQVEGAVNADGAAAALVNLSITGAPGNAQVTAAATPLAGGANAIGAAGSEVVGVVGDAISVTLQSGVSTITQVRTAVNASIPAAALVTATGTSATVVTAPVAALNLQNGANSIGAAGSEVVNVVGDAISVTLESGVSTITQVRTAVNASIPAAALVTASGTSGTAVTAPVAATFLAGGDDGNTENNCGPLVESIERTGIGQYTVILKDRYYDMQSAKFQLGSQSPQDIIPQISDYDLPNKTLEVTFLNGTTPTDIVGGGVMFMKMILNNSSVR